MPRAATQLAGLVSSGVCRPENDMGTFAHDRIQMRAWSWRFRHEEAKWEEMFYVDFIQPGNPQ